MRYLGFCFAPIAFISKFGFGAAGAAGGQLLAFRAAGDQACGSAVRCGFGVAGQQVFIVAADGIKVFVTFADWHVCSGGLCRMLTEIRARAKWELG